MSLTMQQAKKYFTLLQERFPDDWQSYYQFLFVKIYHPKGKKKYTGLDLLVKTREDLFVLALAQDGNLQKCFDLINTVLTEEELYHFFIDTLRMAAKSADKEHSPEAIVRTQDAIPKRIFHHFLQAKKIMLANLIREDCLQIVDIIYQDIIKSYPEGDLIPIGYKMSEDCGRQAIIRIKKINETIIKYLTEEPLLKRLFAEIKMQLEVKAQREESGKEKSAVLQSSEAEVLQILLGILSMSFVGDTVANYTLPTLAKPSKADGLKRVILTTYCSSVFSYLIAGQHHKKQGLEILPPIYHDFIGSQKKEDEVNENKAGYVNFCKASTLKVGFAPAEPLGSLLAEKKTIKRKNDHIADEFRCQLAFHDVYVQFILLKEQFYTQYFESLNRMRPLQSVISLIPMQVPKRSLNSVNNSSSGSKLKEIKELSYEDLRTRGEKLFGDLMRYKEDIVNYYEQSFPRLLEGSISDLGPKLQDQLMAFVEMVGKAEFTTFITDAKKLIGQAVTVTELWNGIHKTISSDLGSSDSQPSPSASPKNVLQKGNALLLRMHSSLVLGSPPATPTILDSKRALPGSHVDRISPSRSSAALDRGSKDDKKDDKSESSQRPRGGHKPGSNHS